MPRKRAKAWEEPPPKKRSNPLRAAWGAFVTVLVLLVIAYVTGLFIGRTDGFRAIVAGRLEKALGAPVKIDRVSLDAAYNMTLTGVETDTERRAGIPGLRVGRVRLEWRWGDLMRRGKVGISRIELEKPTLAVGRDDAGRWTPKPVAPLSDFVARQLQFTFPAPSQSTDVAPAATPSESDKPASTPGFDLKGLDTAIVIRRGEVSWWLDSSAPHASVEGISLDATPLPVPGRLITHYLLTVKRAASKDGPAFRDLTVELLDVGDQQIVLRFAADHQR